MSFLALEPLLKDRLSAALNPIDAPSVTHILSAADLASVDGTHPVPAVIVLFDSHSVAENVNSGKHARITQSWLAIVAVRSVTNIKTGQNARALAGEIADTVLTNLMGWMPPGCTKPLHLANAPKADYVNGFLYLPIAFEAEIVRKAAA